MEFLRKRFPDVLHFQKKIISGIFKYALTGHLVGRHCQEVDEQQNELMSY